MAEVQQDIHMAEVQQDIQDILAGNAFTLHNFIEAESVERDRAVFRLDVRPESLNPYGMVHGGALYTLADDAAGAAVHTDGRHYVTQNGSLNFLKNQTQGTIRAAAHVRHRGRSTCLVDVDITGDNDVLLATGQFTYFRVDIQIQKTEQSGASGTKTL